MPQQEQNPAYIHTRTTKLDVLWNLLQSRDARKFAVLHGRLDAVLSSPYNRLRNL